MVVPCFKRTIDRYHLLQKGDRLIVGVSGGVDSMVLLHLLNTLRPTLQLDLMVAHINHGLRPAESAGEAGLVRSESERLGLRFEYAQFDVRALQKSQGGSLQEVARRVRFHFLNGLLRKHRAQKIALGHNADDQVETILLRLLRGSGLRGLKGMLPIRQGRVIRPLLETWRSDLESFAREREIPYQVDSSNLKDDYLRNRLRLKLIPLLEREYQPNFKAVMLRTSSVLREEDDYLERGTQEAYEMIVCEEREGLRFRWSQFQSLHEAIRWRILRRMLESMASMELNGEEGEPFDVGRISERLAHPSSSFVLSLPGGLRLEKRYDEVALGKTRSVLVPPFEVELQVPGRTDVREIGKSTVVEELPWTGGNPIPGEALHIAFLDAQQLEFPLKLRNFRPGDRFYPLGVGGRQKVKEFFIDHKIPRFERPRIPLLISGETIAWVVGYRMDERFRVTDKTRRVLKVEVS